MKRLLVVLLLIMAASASLPAAAQDGGQITSANADRVVQIASLEYHSVPVPAWSPDGKMLAIMPRFGDTTYLCLYEVHNGESPLVAVTPDLVVGTVFSQDGTTLDTDTGRETPALCDWDPATQAEPAPLVFGSNIDESILKLKFSPDGSRLTVVQGCAFGDVALSVWDPTNRTLLLHETSAKHGSIPVAFSPDGKTLAYGFENGWIHLWDVEAQEQRAIWKGHESFVTSLAFSPDGTILASGGEDGLVILWETISGARRSVLESHSGWVMDLAFSPDGKTLASTSEDGTVRLWDVSSGEERASLIGSSQKMTSQLVFSPDGTLLVSGGWDGIVRLWYVTAGIDRTAAGSSPVFSSLAFSPDGTLLATASDDGTIHLWDVASGEERAALHGHTWATALAFSPDGTTLITWDGAAIRVWGVR